MRKFSDFVVWSNLAFLFPLFITILKSSYLYTILIFVVFVLSSLFHLNNEKKYRVADSFFALSLIIVNLYIFYLDGFDSHFWVALVFVAIAFYFKRKNHSIWHLASAIITTLAAA